MSERLHELSNLRSAVQRNLLARPIASASTGPLRDSRQHDHAARPVLLPRFAASPDGTLSMDGVLSLLDSRRRRLWWTFAHWERTWHRISDVRSISRSRDSHLQATAQTGRSEAQLGQRSITYQHTRGEGGLAEAGQNTDDPVIIVGEDPDGRTTMSAVSSRTHW